MKHINFTIFLILLSVGAFAQNDDLEATCPNVMDLHSSRVTCTYGYYDNPDQYNGIVDYGQYSATPSSPTPTHTTHIQETS